MKTTALRRILGAAIGFTLAWVNIAGAATINWDKDVATGSFHSPDSWVGDDAPGPADIARFTTGAVHTVTFTEDVTTAELQGAWKESTLTDVTFNFGGFTYTATTNMLIGNWCDTIFRMQNGALETSGFIIYGARSIPNSYGDGRGTLILSGSDMEWINTIGTASDFTVGGTLRILDGAVVATSGRRVDILGSISVAAVVEVSGSDSVFRAAGTGSVRESLNIGGQSSVSHGRLAISGGGLVDMHWGEDGKNVNVGTAAGGQGELNIDDGLIRARNVDFYDVGVFNLTLHSSKTGSVVRAIRPDDAPGGQVQIHPDAQFNLTLAPGFSSTPGETFTVIHARNLYNMVDSSEAPYFSDLAHGEIISDPSGYEFQVGYEWGVGGSDTDKSFYLTTVAIPEPGSVALLGSALALLGLLRRQARHRIRD